MKALLKDETKKGEFKVTIYHKLPVIEVLLYYIGWISGMLYIFYEVYLTGKNHLQTNTFLKDGWSFTQLKRDTSDAILETAYNSITYIVALAILHFAFAEFLKWWWIKVLPYFYFLFSLGVIVTLSNYKVGLVIVIQAGLNYIMAYFGSKFYIWCYTCTAIIAVYLSQQNILNWCGLNNFQLSLLTDVLMWNILRYLIFAIDLQKIKEKEKIEFSNFVNFLGYCFYLPTICYGPILLYHNFIHVYKEKVVENFYMRLKVFMVSMGKFTFYLYLTIFLLHFLHCGLLFQLQYIDATYAASHGFFWWAAYLFMLNYIIIYGLVTTVAKAEGIVVPNLPKCIGTIALYSKMWKSFDQSMYCFKKKYIMEAYVNNSKSKIDQVTGAFLCFTFVTFWNGGRLGVVVWAVLNFIGVLLEQLGQRISTTTFCLKIYRNYFNPQNFRRLGALLSVPLLSISCVSHCFFFTTTQTAQHYLHRISQEDYWNNGIVLLTLYCGCQVSIETTMREQINETFKHKKIK